MLGWVLYFLAIFLIIDIARRTKGLIEESEEDEGAEINRTTPISRRTYDKTG